jgi:WD40 repeat protein
VLADGRLASGGEDGKIKLWPKDGAGEPLALSQGSQVTSLTVLADGRLASGSGGKHAEIRLWPKDGAGEPLVLWQGPDISLPGGGEVTSLTVLTVLADGRLASGGTDETIKLWPKDGAGDVVVSQGSAVTSLTALADGRLASGGDGGWIWLWPKKVVQKPGHVFYEFYGKPVRLSQGSAVTSLTVLADGRLASGGADGKIRLWPKDGAGQPVVLSQGSAVTSLTVLADGRLASGGADGKIRLWLVDERKLVSALCLRAGHNLTKEEWDRFIGSETPWQPSCRDLPTNWRTSATAS